MLMNNAAYASFEGGDGINSTIMRQARTVGLANEDCFGSMEKNFGAIDAAFLHTYAVITVKRTLDMGVIGGHDAEEAANQLRVARVALERALELARSYRKGAEEAVDRKPIRRTVMEPGSSAKELQDVIEKDLARVKEIIRTNG